MNHLHPDAQAMAKVHIIHGFTDPQDSNLTRLERQAARYKNVKLHLAFMPEPFLSGHHSKMLILFRYNGTAQVIIHTANMTENDWNNKTNGVWVSPLLPRMSYKDNHKVSHIGEIGSGSRFKHDLVNYLNSYNARWDVCNNMIRHLREFDFSPIRAALIASVPGRRLVEEDLSSLETQWGMEALKKTLEVVPVQNIRKSEVVTQVTSMAPIGATTRWLNRFFDAVSRARPPPIVPRSLLPRPYNPLQPFKLWKPWQKIIFPSDDEIRLSLDGYQAGTSIITKTKTHQGMKQYEYLKGYLNHWRNDSELGFLRRPREEVEQEKIAVSAPIISNKDAGRQRAVPNLATYIRYSNGTRAARPAIDWALLTSANLSVQSWGEAPNKSNRVRISSWELGVMVWPDLFAPDAAATKSASGDGSEPRGKVRMVATFKTDLPEEEEKDEEKEYEEEEEEDDDDEYKEKEEEEKKGVDSGDGGPGSKGVLVGIRLPYSLPLMQYADGEIPWTRDQDYPEPDVFGNVWLNGESVSDTSGKALDEGSERKPYPKPGQQLDPGAKAVYQGPEGLEKHVVARGWLF